MLGIVALVAIVVAVTGGGGGGGEVLPATTAATETAPSTTPPTTGTQPSTTTAPTTTTSTVQPLSLPDAGSLREGDNGPAVEQLQRILNALGYDAGTPDGAFGGTTKAAVVAFQEANGLGPDGIVGTNTVQALNDALASTQAG